MTTTASQIRILALANEPVADPGARPTRFSKIFSALDRRFEVVGGISPLLPKLEDYLVKLRYVYPDMVGWRGRAEFNSWRFKRQSAIAGKQLKRWEGARDLIMLVQTEFTPGRSNGRYVVYTDNTQTITERHYPAWVPLGRHESRKVVRLEQDAFQGAAFVFAMSNFLRDAAIEDYGCDPQRVVTVRAGADSIVDSLARKDYGSQVALFGGIEFERKGGPVLLRAWELVRQQLPDAELWIAGPNRLPKTKPAGVRLLGRIADRAALAALYDRATVFVLPSLFEPYGLVIAEAKGHGLPCVVADCGGISEQVEDGATGRVVPAGEAEPLAEALIELLADPERAASMGRAAHEDILRAGTWDHVVERMAPGIEEAAAS